MQAGSEGSRRWLRQVVVDNRAAAQAAAAGGGCRRQEKLHSKGKQQAEGS